MLSHLGHRMIAATRRVGGREYHDDRRSSLARPGSPVVREYANEHRSAPLSGRATGRLCDSRRVTEPVDFNSFGLPLKRVGAGLLIRDVAGRVLVVDPTYKDAWEIPGGMVELDESPREAAAREAEEELSRVFDVGDLLIVAYSEGGRTPLDGIMFVFDGGRSYEDASSFALPADELRAAEFVSLDRLGDFLIPTMADRMRAAASASDSGRITYLER